VPGNRASRKVPKGELAAAEQVAALAATPGAPHDLHGCSPDVPISKIIEHGRRPSSTFYQFNMVGL
jgi:hypothetical protein